MITKDLVDQKYTRATVAEVYKQIEDDLKEASKSLKEVPINLFHPYLGSLHSFYARLYLYMGRYDDALTEAKEALKLNDKLQDLCPYQTKDKTTWGRIVLPDGTPMLEIFLQHLSVTCLQERQTSAVLCFMPTIPSTWDVPIIFTGRLAIFYMLIRT